jgi:hypothetical protein
MASAAETIAFAAEFRPSVRGAGALLAGTRLGFRQFLVNQPGLLFSEIGTPIRLILQICPALI